MNSLPTLFLLVSTVILILGLQIDGASRGYVTFPSHCAFNESGILMLGIPNITENRVEYCAFYGIPFATPPVGEHRFRRAKLLDLKPRSDGHEFIHKPPDCKQNYYKLFGQEDCLYLNVFSKQRSEIVARKRPFPVVVWTHGGSLFVGSGLSDTFSPNSMIDEDIVVVSFNYRLNLFGFFGDANYALNVGLDDQKVALQWVQKNIHLFGGDPQRVTIMGWSAGSGSVTFLLYNKEAKGLFHSAIAMSGSFLSPWAFINDPLAARQSLCDHHKIGNCTLDGIVSSMGCNLTKLINIFSSKDKSVSTNVFGNDWSLFRPSPEYPGDSPWSRMATGEVNDVPLLMGLTNDDLGDHQLGKSIFDRPSFRDFPNDDEKMIMDTFQMLREMNCSKTELRDSLKMAFMFHGVYKFLDLHAKRSKADLFFFRLNYNPTDGSRKHVVHGEDLKLIFRSYDKNIPCNENAAAQMNRIWTSFIINRRSPITEPLDDNEIRGQPAACNSDAPLDVLLINRTFDVASQLTDSPLYGLWDGIYECLYNNNTKECDKPLPKRGDCQLAKTSTDDASGIDTPLIRYLISGMTLLIVNLQY